VSRVREFRGLLCRHPPSGPDLHQHRRRSASETRCSLAIGTASSGRKSSSAFHHALVTSPWPFHLTHTPPVLRLCPAQAAFLVWCAHSTLQFINDLTNIKRCLNRATQNSWWIVSLFPRALRPSRSCLTPTGNPLAVVCWIDHTWLPPAFYMNTIISKKFPPLT
jgi:hypothetical protein